MEGRVVGPESEFALGGAASEEVEDGAENEFLGVVKVDTGTGVEGAGRGVDFVLREEIAGHGADGLSSSLLLALLVQRDVFYGLERRSMLPASSVSCDARKGFEDCSRNGCGIDTHWSQSFVLLCSNADVSQDCKHVWRSKLEM